MSKLVVFNSYVYLIGYGDKVKIGKANNPEQRLATFQTGIPEDLIIFGLIGCNSDSEALTLESKLHYEYKEVNIRGEWFNLNSSERNFLLSTYTDTTCVTIPQTELTSAMTDLSTGAYLLLMYYYSKRDGWTFVDDNIARTINTSVRQVKKFRKELIDKQYLLIQRGQVDVYFIGQIAVDRFINSITSEEEEEPMEPLIATGDKNE